MSLQVDSVAAEILYRGANDPFAVTEMLWPQYYLYDKQREMFDSVWNVKRTYVPAGHMLGKDFGTGMLVLVFMVTRWPCRIVTTSVDAKQLEVVLWGEIKRFIQESAIPLTRDQGGPLQFNHLHIRRNRPGSDVLCGLSYLIGRVAEKGEGMSGHHIAKTGDGIPRTLYVADEASGVDQQTNNKAPEWADRLLFIGNPYDCATEFKWAVRGRPGTKDRGGPVRDERGKLVRNVIRITGWDSPNVRLALEQIARGEEPTNEVLIPGLLTYPDLVERLQTWDPVKIAVGIQAIFYEGVENFLYPEFWLNHSEDLDDAIPAIWGNRTGKGLGVDPGQGEANTALTVVDEWGIIEQESRRTPDTSVIDGWVLSFARRWKCPFERILFDAGGGGLNIAQRLQRQGYPVKTVGFGEAATDRPRKGMKTTSQRVQEIVKRYAFKNKRAEMYHDLRELINPSNVRQLGPGGKHRWPGFALPRKYIELRRQLAPLPLLYDPEGRLYLPPKEKNGPTDTRTTLRDILGCSPDEADSTVLAVHAMLGKAEKIRVGAMKSRKRRTY